MVDITFEPKEINELAEKVFQKIMFGSLNSVSVGFLPLGKGHWGEGDEAPNEARETYYYDGQELLEISVVNIPSNANATRKGEDASMEELEALRAEAKAADPDPEPQPDPDPEPDPKPEGRDVKSVLQAAQIVMAASSALL